MQRDSMYPRPATQCSRSTHISRQSFVRRCCSRYGMHITFGGGTSARKGWTVGISSAGTLLWYVSSYPSSRISSDGPSCSVVLKDMAGRQATRGAMFVAGPASNNALGAMSRRHDHFPLSLFYGFALIGTLAVLSNVGIHAVNAIDHWWRGCFPIARR